jgi:predicted amidohydrolase
MDAVAVELPGEPFASLIEACGRWDCYFVTTTQERTSKLPGRYFHTGFIVGPEGLVLRSPKVQAPSAAEVSILHSIHDESVSVFSENSILPVAETPVGTLGCFVEGEALVPETARMLRSRGAEVVVHPTLEHGDQAVPNWPSVKSTVAYSAGVYLLSACTSRILAGDGADAQESWCGGSSSIYGPDGTLLASVSGDCEGYAAAWIDLDHLQAVRAEQGRHTNPAAINYRGLYG